jgi:hypothetical protein
MSQTNDFRQANNPDRVYYDILQHNIGRDTETPARFIETTETPIINNTGDYKMSVVRFQIDTPNMPVLIIQPNTDKTLTPYYHLQNSQQYIVSAYKINFLYFGLNNQENINNLLINKSFYIDWVPQNQNLYKPTFEEYKDGKHINYEYFYCYSYSYFFDFIVNQSIQNYYASYIDDIFNNYSDDEAQYQFSTWSYPPTFEWDENTQKINIVVPPNYYLVNDFDTSILGSGRSIPINLALKPNGEGENIYSNAISVSPNFYTLISTFPYRIDRLYNATTLKYEDFYTLQFKTNFITNWFKQQDFHPNWYYTFLNVFIPTIPPPPLVYGAYLIRGEQEWSSIDLMTPINSIVFISNTLPIIANQQSASKSKNNKDIFTPDSERSTTQHLLMITDLMTNQQGYRPNLLYVPSGQYRYITLTGNQPLNQIDINVFYQLKTGDLIPFQLTNGGTASIKLLFEKVVLGETKTLQFANMSMRDLKL